MKNDITRDTFHRMKHFSRVLMQQGRVQLDADWNEQISILLDYLRTLTRDLLGPGAGPDHACGFEVVVDPVQLKDLSAEQKTKWTKFLKEEQVIIAPGHYYVDGLLAENERFASFFQQLGRLAPDQTAEKILSTVKDEDLLIYLDVWERHITPIDDDDIREKALGGPDTATRAKVEWTVRARVLSKSEQAARKKAPVPKNPATLRDRLDPLFEEWNANQWKNRGLLRAGIKPNSESDDPCVSSPESVYRGLENQLYRVEIHRGGTAWNGEKATLGDAATFKWSRDNGSVAAARLASEGAILKITAGRDQARGFASGQWVELTDDSNDLQSTPGTLVQVKEVEAGTLTIDPTTTTEPAVDENFPLHPKVRRWDQEETEVITLNEGAITIQYDKDKWFALEDGVQIQFPAPTAPETYEFRSGDYWLIPARVATRDIEWPWESNKDTTKKTDPERAALPPHGIKHHYALLGLLTAKAGGALEFTDLRRKFAPLDNV